MAESPDKASKSAEQAYAEAAAAKPAAPAPVKAEPVPAKADPVPAATPVAAKTAAKKAAPKRRPSSSKVAAKSAKKPAAKAKPAPKFKPAPQAALPAVKVADTPKPTITQLKDKIMATAKTTDFTKPFADAVNEMQTKAKEAFEKGTAYAGEMTEFAKGNVEALVESGKVLSTGAQDLGKVYVDEAKSAYETLTADLKEMAGVKSPTELLQLQAKVARRNFDSMVAYSSKAGDAMLKLYSDAFAPISGRLSLAAEKISKAA